MSDDFDTTPGSAEPKKDLRKTEHDDFDVRVERDLTGSSMFLARGSQQHFSKIQFSLRGRPREATLQPTPEDSPSVPLKEPDEHPGPASVSPEKPGVFARLKGLFGG